jgi:hypothetical protein
LRADRRCRRSRSLETSDCVDLEEVRGRWGDRGRPRFDIGIVGFRGS